MGKNIFFLSLLLCFILAGCGAKNASATAENPNVIAEKAEEKAAEVSKEPTGETPKAPEEPSEDFVEPEITTMTPEELSELGIESEPTEPEPETKAEEPAPAKDPDSVTIDDYTTITSSGRHIIDMDKLAADLGYIAQETSYEYDGMVAHPYIYGIETCGRRIGIAFIDEIGTIGVEINDTMTAELFSLIHYREGNEDNTPTFLDSNGRYEQDRCERVNLDIAEQDIEILKYFATAEYDDPFELIANVPATESFYFYLYENPTGIKYYPNGIILDPSNNDFTTIATYSVVDHQIKLEDDSDDDDDFDDDDDD